MKLKTILIFFTALLLVGCKGEVIDPVEQFNRNVPCRWEVVESGYPPNEHNILFYTRMDCSKVELAFDINSYMSDCKQVTMSSYAGSGNPQAGEKVFSYSIYNWPDNTPLYCQARIISSNADFYAESEPVCLNRDGDITTPPITPPTEITEIPDIDIPAEAISVAQARDICSKLESGATTGTMYYVKGWVKKLHSSQHTQTNIDNYGNTSFYMVDNLGDSDDFMAYQVYGLNGQKLVSVDQVAVGDYVVVYGELTNYNGTYETVGKGATYIYSSSNPNIGSTTPNTLHPSLQGTNYFVFQMDDITYAKIKDKVVADFRPSNTSATNHLYIWTDGVSGFTYEIANCTGTLNFYGEIEDWVSFNVGAWGWSGCGYCSKHITSINLLVGVQNSPEKYYLHIGFKSTTNHSHCIRLQDIYGFSIGKKAVGDAPIYTDYKTDGSWNEIEIPMTYFFYQGLNYSYIPTTNISEQCLVSILSEGIQGANAQWDALFIYKKP